MAIPQTAKTFALGIILSLVHSRGFSVSPVSVFEGFALAVFLAWLIPKVNLKPASTFVLVWGSLFIIGQFNNILEGYFFTTTYSNSGLLAKDMLVSLFITLLQSAFAVLLLRPEGNRNMAEALKSYVGLRTGSSWVKRFVAASVVWFLTYFTFGAIVSPFVMPYYSNPSSGLAIPPITTILLLQLLRGSIYAVMLFVVFAGISQDRKLDFWVALALLYIPGAFLPLIPSVVSPTFLSTVAPIHLVELFADSLVYAYAISRIIGAPSALVKSAIAEQ